MATHRYRWRHAGHAVLKAMRVCLARWYLSVLLLVPVYLSTLWRTPHVLLWVIAAAAACAAGAAATRWPRSVCWWLPPCIILFNTLFHWLPWPYVKIVYIAPVMACAALVCLRPARVRRQAGLHPTVIVLLVCCACCVALGVLGNVLWHEPATWHELRRALRMIPVLDDLDMFVGLRYGYVWLVGLAAYLVVASLITAPRDLRALMLSLHLCAVPMAAFALYSFATSKYMVSYYLYDRRVNATCSTPAVLADITTVLAVLAMQQLLRARRWHERLVLCGALALELIIIVLTGCRLNLVLLALLLAVGGAPWLVWALATQPRKGVKVLVAAALAGVLVSGAAAWRWPYLRHLPVVLRLQDWGLALRTKQYRALLAPGRIDHWQCALQALKAAPLWGLGTGQFETYYTQFRPPADLFDYARAHNALLRMAAEGGLITAVALLAALGWVVWRTALFWRDDARRAAPEWSWFGRAFSIGLLMIALAALSSDVAVENVEAVVFWAMLAGVVRACAWQCERRVVRQPGALAQRWARAERHVQRWCERRGWQRTQRIRLQTLALAGALLLICLLLVPGVHAAHARALARVKRGKVYYGFTYLERSGSSNTRLYTIPQHALALLPGAQPLMVIHYRALNQRMAQREQTMTVYINGMFMAGVLLNSTQERLLYCDISALHGQPLAVSLRVPRAWVPWREGWGLQYQPCGAVVSYPQLIAQEPSNVYGTVCAVWSTNATAYPSFYQLYEAAHRVP